MRSLGFRLTVAAGLVLVIFIAASAFALERAFRDSARSARQERLLAQVYLLMAGAEVNETGRLTLAEDPPEPRLGLVGSGLYASIVDGAGKSVWHSRSTLAATPPSTPTLAPGTQRFETVVAPDGASCFVQSFGVRWATPGGAYPFTFSVAENLDAFERQLGVYRRSLLGWLGGMGLLLLGAQWLTLRWGLRPLRQVADELTALEDGRQSQITGHYPTELQRLASNLNTLLKHERTRQQRYRDTLADLAHSLKTPLAVLRGALREGSADANHASLVDAQVERMDRIVGYHLRRAATSGRPAIGAAHQARPLVERLLAALRKVYIDKTVDVELSIDSALQFRGDEGDLMEAVGNVLDNAFKWCQSRVRVSATLENGAFRLTVEDDGPGIDDAEVRRALERGARIDASVPGHGLGLAVSRDIVESCDGTIAITRSSLGGAAVTLRFTAGGSR
jgi:two-component system, OmpR family, sensor histidine kinase PhoQ